MNYNYGKKIKWSWRLSGNGLVLAIFSGMFFLFSLVLSIETLLENREKLKNKIEVVFSGVINSFEVDSGGVLIVNKKIDLGNVCEFSNVRMFQPREMYTLYVYQGEKYWEKGKVTNESWCNEILKHNRRSLMVSAFVALFWLILVGLIYGLSNLDFKKKNESN